MRKGWELLLLFAVVTSFLNLVATGLVTVVVLVLVICLARAPMQTVMALIGLALASALISYPALAGAVLAVLLLSAFRR